MQVKSNAKINIFLHITNRLNNGYHEISSFMVFLNSLYDEISITKATKAEVIFTNINIGENNTVSHALSLLQEKGYNTDVKITIKKNIPIASGMGGGSGNAAAVLNHFANIYEIPYEEILEMGLKIGTDVIVCLKNKASMVSGIGEKTINIEKIPKIFLVIVNNGKELYAPVIYKDYANSNSDFSDKVDSNMLLDRTMEIVTNSRNDLQPVAINSMPEIAEILNEIKSQVGCIFSRMSGSGPTCFGVFNSKYEAINAEKALQSKYKNYFITSGQIF